MRNHSVVSSRYLFILYTCQTLRTLLFETHDAERKGDSGDEMYLGFGKAESTHDLRPRGHLMASAQQSATQILPRDSAWFSPTQEHWGDMGRWVPVECLLSHISLRNCIVRALFR